MTRSLTNITAKQVRLITRTHLDLLIKLFLELLVLGYQQGFRSAQVAALALHLLHLPRQLIVFSCKGKFEYF